MPTYLHTYAFSDLAALNSRTSVVERWVFELRGLVLSLMMTSLQHLGRLLCGRYFDIKALCLYIITSLSCIEDVFIINVSTFWNLAGTCSCVCFYVKCVCMYLGVILNCAHTCTHAVVFTFCLSAFHFKWKLGSNIWITSYCPQTQVEVYTSS